MSGATCPRCGLRSAGTGLTLCPRCLLTDDDAPAVATTFPGLALEGEIGRGGMGRVFRARQLRLDRPVAVKLLPPELSTDPSFEARFEREARALAMLNHPHIVHVHDFGTTADGQSFLVMELVEGGTLAARLPLAPDEAVATAIALCEGVAYAHAKNVVHRDIKPENVLFDADGRVKLADFGIARLIEPDAAAPNLTRPSLVLGTPAYMAPEARTGAPPSPRMDVYALGVLLHQMLTGHTPGTGPAVPAHFAAVIARATASDPEQRLANASLLRDELLAVRAHTGAPPLAVTAPSRSRLPPDEESWQRAVALTLAGATAVALYAFLVSFTPRTQDEGATLPLVSFGVQRLPGGKVFTQARFETWPTLGAAAAFALAAAAYGLLRRHWRYAGLDRATPERPLAGSKPVARLGVFLLALFGFGLLIEQTAARPLATYIPVLGGVLELVMLYQVWLAVLEARRTGRQLRKEPWLWIGLLVSLVPPLVSFFRVLGGSGP